MANKDFSLRPFYLGALVGIRSFGIGLTLTNQGFHPLVGPVFPQPFLPGENVAECRKPVGDSNHPQTPSGVWLGEVHIAPPTGEGRRPMPANVRLATERLLRHLGAHDPNLPESLLEEGPKHRVAQQDCTCGYYAYFDRIRNPHHHGGQVLGIVEGYGTVTVGEHGFRAEKARLLALIAEEMDGCCRLCRATGVVKEFDPEVHKYFDIPCTDCRGTKHAHEPECQCTPRDRCLLPPDIFDAYNVPVFSSVDQALAEYPLTVPDIHEEAS